MVKMPANQNIVVSLLGCLTVGFGAALGFILGLRISDSVQQAWTTRYGNLPEPSNSSQEMKMPTIELNSVAPISGKDAARDDAPVQRKDFNMKVQMEIRKRPVV